MKLVLFDIDGTILWTDGAGRRALTRALTVVFGCEGPAGHRFDGKTDPQIVREMMHIAGFAPDEIDRRLPALLELYVASLEEELRSGAAVATLFHGVPELLDALEARDDVVLGLLTGNLRRGAALKLAAVGLDPQRFRVGAFGCDSAERPRLPAIAQQRARDMLGLEIAGERVVVIGDTPADVQCGRDIGARAIAVATGRYGRDELLAHDPAAVFDSLADTAAVLDAILAPGASARRGA